MTWVILAGAIIGVIALGFILWRVRDNLPQIGGALLTREGLAAAALLLTFGAGIVFSTMLATIIAYLKVEKRSDDLAHLSFGLLAVLAITMWSLHRLLGSKQALEVEFWKFRASLTQGDNPIPVEVVNRDDSPVPVEPKGDGDAN